MERSKQVEHQEDIQQRYFNSYQPKVPKQQHQYPTGSKTATYEVETVAENEENPPVGGKNSSFSETMGRRNLFLYSLSLFFEMN